MRKLAPKTLALAALLACALPASAQPNDPEEWPIVRLEFKEARIVDVIRLLAEVAPLNIVASDAAGQKKVSLYLQNVTAKNALETICKASGLWYRQDAASKTIRVLTAEEYQKDLVVFREDRIKVFTLLHPNAVATATAIQSLFGDRVVLSLGVPEDVTGLQTYGQNFALVGGGLGSGGLSGSGQIGGNRLGTTGTGLGTGTTSGLGSLGAGGYGSGLGGYGGGYGGYGNNRAGFGANRSGQTGGIRQRTSENVVDEKLTADQLAELEKRRAAAPDDKKDSMTAEALRGLTRQEAPIYVTVNSAHNLIVVRTSDEKALAAIESLVTSLDRPVPQVLLEMKILELDLTDDFTSIFDFDYAGVETQHPGNSIATKSNPFLTTGAAAPPSVVGAGNFGLNPSSTLIYQFLNDRIRARVQLLETEHRVNVLSTPLLLCANHGSARLFVGEERPLTNGFQAQSNFTQTTASTIVVPTTEIRDVGTSLQIVPQINADRTVTLTVFQESSTLNPASANVPVPLNNGTVQTFAVDTVNTSNLAGTVVAKDSMTIAVGGLIQDRIERNEQKIPFLGDLPLLGVIFRNTARTRHRSELVLLITPRVLFTPAEAQGASRERLLALSIHPYQDKGDRAAQAYEKHEVPQADRANVFFRDLLAPDPEGGK